MSTILNQVYSAKSGKGIGAGIVAPVNNGGPASAVPSWVPPPGYFADIPMKNTAVDVKPSFYSQFEVNSTFSYWGGSAMSYDYCPLGAQIFHSAGHEPSPTNNNTQLTLVCNFSTLMWECVNVPAVPNVANTADPTTGYFPDGTSYSGHTYLGMQEFPYTWGGGSRGTLIQMLTAGAPYQQRIKLLDLSKSVGGWSIMPTVQPGSAPDQIWFQTNAVGNSYPISCIDYKRQGWWLASTGSVEYTLFIDKSGTVTRYPAIGGNGQNMSMVLVAKYDILLGIDGGYETGYYASNAYRSTYARDLKTGTTVTKLTLGPVVPQITVGYDGGPNPNFHRPDVMGLEWVDELNCAVGLDQSTTPPTIFKLVPGADPLNDPWTWQAIPMQHWSAGDPNGKTAIAVPENGAWSKFRYNKMLKAFTLGISVTDNPQIINVPAS